MRKFTKVCLITTLVTFLIGCLLCGVGALLGGLRQLGHIGVRELTGIPFYYGRNGGGINFGFWDGRWDDGREEYWDWDSDDWKAVEATGSVREGMETGLTADTLRGLDLEVGACKMYIKESADDQVSIAVSGECEDHYQYRIKDQDTLLLVHKDMRYDDVDGFWGRNHPKGDTQIYLYLPEGAALDDINLNFGAGKLESGYLRAREIEINVGAGDCRFEGMEASESINISLGAGTVETDALITGEANLDIAAGELLVSGAKVSHASQVNLSMGNAVLIGAFNGELDVECSMGNLDLILEGAETDYNYDIDCGLGNVKIGGRRYNNLIYDEIDHDSDNRIAIDCSMGNVDVGFIQ